MAAARAVRFHKPGGPEVMQFDTLDLPVPQAGEVQVRNTAIGLNFQDIYQRSGFYPLPLPSGIGTEAAGVVEACGPGVTLVKVGDRVCYAGGPIGAYADRRILPGDRLVKIPEGISDEQAAASLLKGMTVEYLLNRTYPLRAGQHALFYAAAGGVGLIAGQWGKAIGARMIGVVSGPEKAKLALENGYSVVIDRTKEKVVDRVKEITGGAMLPVVYDSVGKATFDDSMNSLAPRGFFVSFGAASGAPPAVEAGLLQKLGSLYFTRPTLLTYCAKREDLEASSAALFAMIAKGAVKIRISERYKMDDVQRAHADLQSGKSVGSSIIIP
jgi:NADPH2:quinone reductase